MSSLPCLHIFGPFREDRFQLPIKIKVFFPDCVVFCTWYRISDLPNCFQRETNGLIRFPFPFFLILSGCRCHVEGSANRLCHRQSGQCVCKPNVMGRQCNKCMVGYWNVQSGVGCIPCSCDPNGSGKLECDTNSGQCFCKDGVEGVKCDRCQQGYYGFSSQGCKSKYDFFSLCFISFLRCLYIYLSFLRIPVNTIVLSITFGHPSTLIHVIFELHQISYYHVPRLVKPLVSLCQLWHSFITLFYF